MDRRGSQQDKTTDSLSESQGDALSFERWYRFSGIEEPSRTLNTRSRASPQDVIQEALDMKRTCPTSTLLHRSTSLSKRNVPAHTDVEKKYENMGNVRSPYTDGYFKEQQMDDSISLSNISLNMSTESVDDTQDHKRTAMSRRICNERLTSNLSALDTRHKSRTPLFTSRRRPSFTLPNGPPTKSEGAVLPDKKKDYIFNLRSLQRDLPSATHELKRPTYLPRYGDICASGGPNRVQRILPVDSTSSALHPIANDRPQSLTGLKNMGNTCYMNATLQCLSNIRPLRHYFLHGRYQTAINLENRMGGTLATQFALLLHDLWKESRKISPSWLGFGDRRQSTPADARKLKQAMERWAPQFQGYRQEDSQEFLRFLLDGLHEDLNRITVRPPYVELKDIEGETDHEKGNRWWRNYLERNDSLITELFCGQLKSAVRCLSCGYTSTSFDPFLDVSLPIPQNDDLFSSVSGRGKTLAQCFEKFEQEELLEGSNQVYCSKCKSHQAVRKRISFYRFPAVLVVHLKRFSSLSRKVLDDVWFPTEDMDLSAHVDSESKRYIHQPSPVYDLLGIVNHFGASNGGHYTCYARQTTADPWVSYNDAQVRVLSGNNVRSSSAYVLFYTRRR